MMAAECQGFGKKAEGLREVSRSSSHAVCRVESFQAVFTLLLSYGATS